MADEAKRIEGLYLETLSRLIWILREKYPKVLEANRRFEEETERDNEFGTNNLVDALSHIGTLCERGTSLSLGEQRDQVTQFEDHLRRSMMEAWEQMLTFRIGEIDEQWDKYVRLARPLQVSGDLQGCPSHRELDRLRRKYKQLLDKGRNAKRAARWEEWEAGTDCLIEACETATAMLEGVEQSIGAAKQHRRDTARDRGNRRRTIVGILVAAVIGVGGIIVGVVTREQGGKTRTVTVPAAPPAPRSP